MRKFLFVLLSLFIITNHLSANENESLKVVYANFWEPYSHMNQDGKVQGILVDIVDELLNKKLNINVNHTGQPWKRAQKSVRGGFQDAMITSPTNDRLIYSKSTTTPLYYIQWRAFISKKSKYYFKLMGEENPLENTSLNFVSLFGDSTSEVIYKKNGINYEQVKNISSAIKMLDRGRADVFIHSKVIMFQHLNRLNMQDSVTMHKKKYKNVPFTLLISKKSKSKLDLIPKIDELVNQMKDNGEYEKFIEEIENKNLN